MQKSRLSPAGGLATDTLFQVIGTETRRARSYVRWEELNCFEDGSRERAGGKGVGEGEPAEGEKEEEQRGGKMTERVEQVEQEGGRG